MELRSVTVFLLVAVGTHHPNGVGSTQTDRRSKISDTENMFEDSRTSQDVYQVKHVKDEREGWRGERTKKVSGDEDKQRSETLRAMERSPSDVPHSRQKRLLWITNDGRLALPPGTSLIIAPTLSMPLVRHPLKGFFSNFSMSTPTTIDFDKLGLTDNENPYGDLPFFSRSMGKAAGGFVADFVGRYLDKRRGKRGLEDDEIPEEMKENVMRLLHGGERAMLYTALEDLLYNFGFEGKPCLLRAICEVHAHPLTNFGLLGEMLKLFFTASKSPFSHLLSEYVEAERAGNGESESPGECWPYFKDCPKSLFLPGKNKYSKNAEKEHQDENNAADDQDILKYNKLTLGKHFNDLNEINVQQM